MRYEISKMHQRQPKIAHVFLLLCIYRVVNAWMVRTQFDPDEYWQTLEPAYCLAFGPRHEHEPQLVEGDDTRYGCALTWEWTRRLSIPDETESGAFLQLLHQAMYGPIRSYISVLPTYWYYLVCREFFNWSERSSNEHLKTFVHRHASYIISKGPVFLHAITVAAPTDISTWLIASSLEKLGGVNSRHHSTSLSFWAVFLSLTSWFHGYALIRTYANCFETMCLAVGIVLLSPELLGSRNTKEFSFKAKLAFVLGGLSACVRFTSLAAWIPLGIIVAARSGSIIRTLFGLCALYGAIGIGLGCIIDRIMYGFWAVPFLGSFHFNVLLGLGSLYGTHPFLWYIYTGIPAVCGAILIPFLSVMHDLCTSIYTARCSNKSIDDRTKARLSLLIIICSYTILHSFSEHKEFRFILPILPLVIALAGESMTRLLSSRDAATQKKMKTGICIGFVLLNFPHLIYLGTIHQRGPIALNRFLVNDIAASMPQKEQINIHYLMGCHSAPLYSHLHIPGVEISSWHLDCSPECRSQHDLLCESDAFLLNPVAFVTSAYCEGSGGDFNACKSKKDEQCLLEQFEQSTRKEVPTYAILMQDDAAKVEHKLRDLNISHLASIRHTIKSFAWKQTKRTCDSTSNSTPASHDSFSFFSLFYINFEHIEVYKHN